MELKCTNLQKELITLWEEVEAANSLQEAVKLHDSPSTLAARVTKLEGSLRDGDKRYKASYNSIEEKAILV